MLTSKLSNLSLQYQSQTSNIKSIPLKKTSWIRTFANAGLSLTGLGILSQLIYNSYYSPSHPSHSLESISLTWKFSDSNTLADSKTFKTAQTFYNIFETKSAFFHSLGLITSEPFGDLQAFALDGDLKALKQAYSSYSQNQVTSRMKDKLLGRVLRHINQNHKNLTAILKWLLSIGANINHQEMKTLLESKDLSESTYSTLLTAFKNLDVDLYEYLISKGANAGMQIHRYSTISKKFDQTSTIFESIIIDSEISLQNPTKLKEAYLCPIYKRIIDVSLPNFSSEKEFNNFRVKTYIEKIQPYFCQNYFTVTEQEKLNYRSEKILDDFKKRFEWFYKSNNQQPPQEEPSSEEDESMQYFESEAFNDATEQIKKTMDSAQEFIYENTKAAKNKVSDIAVKIGNSDAITSANKFLSKIVIVARDTTTSAAKSVKKLVVDAADKSVEIAINIIKSDAVAIVGEFALNAINTIENFAVSAVNLTVNAAKKTVNEATNVIYSVSNSETLTVAKEGLFNAVSAAKDQAVQMAQKATEEAANVVDGISNSEALASAKEGLFNIASSFKETADSAASSINEAATENLQSAKETIEELVDSSKETNVQTKK